MESLNEELEKLNLSIDDKQIGNYYTIILKGRKLFHQLGLNTSTDDNYTNNNAPKESNLTDFNLISSLNQYDKNLHYPVIDMDYPVFLVPSSPNKNHLIINQGITTDQYKKLLEGFYMAGLIQKGILNQFQKYKATYIRKFSITKNNIYISNLGKNEGNNLFLAYKQLNLTKQILEKIIFQKDKLIESQRQEILELKNKLGNQ